MSKFRRLAVVTGDHGRADSTKLAAAWSKEDLIAHGKMVEALESLGRFDLEVIDDHSRIFERIASFRPDLVLNFCDTGLFNLPTRELNLPAQLELMDIPYTGATPQAMVLCFDKQAVRLIAQALGVEVPVEVYISALPAQDDLPEIYPALLKPNQADGSVGITKDAVVHNPAEARAYLDFLRRELPGRDVLWQEYLPGPEYGIGLLGNTRPGLSALPPLEVDFSALPAGCSPILSFESKVDPQSPYWTDIRFHAAEMAPETEARLVAWSKLLFRRLGLQDYGRFDFRCGADGRPKLMEVNPNPAWGYDAKLAIMAGIAGLSYARMLERVIDAAIARIA